MSEILGVRFGIRQIIMKNSRQMPWHMLDTEKDREAVAVLDIRETVDFVGCS